MVLFIDDLLAVPLTLSRQIIEALIEEAEKETLTSAGAIRQKISDLQIAYEEGDLSEDEYHAWMQEMRSRLLMIGDT
ncbi:hypothetical protein [Methanocalculus sp.]|uniref:gas vesicle protein GvpG n=1 Tax=Methanocalculus sp. TaxID=2004547 RepID=UPI0027260F95|nr:hypothetical protein [Methanocalculus sp.]MDO8841922.1 hypothetical protein [Methanocalculus sp.]